MQARVFGTIAVSAVFLVGVAAGPSPAAIVKNGDFETGTLAKWKQRTFGAGVWKVYQTGGEACGGPSPSAIAGTFSAITDQDAPSREVIFQDLRLPDAGRLRLGMKLGYLSFAPIAAPNTLETSVVNQQFRVDVLKESAPPFSMAGGKILKTVYETNDGDPQSAGPLTARANLSKYRGDEVRLRLAVTATQGCLVAVVDSIKVKEI